MFLHMTAISGGLEAILNPFKPISASLSKITLFFAQNEKIQFCPVWVGGWINVLAGQKYQVLEEFCPIQAYVYCKNVRFLTLFLHFEANVWGAKKRDPECVEPQFDFKIQFVPSKISI